MKPDAAIIARRKAYDRIGRWMGHINDACADGNLSDVAAEAAEIRDAACHLFFQWGARAYDKSVDSLEFLAWEANMKFLANTLGVTPDLHRGHSFKKRS